MTKINEILKRIGISQERLAEIVGVSQSSINHYAKGNRKPNYQIAWKIVDSLNQLGANCSFDDVFPNPQGNDL
ncbi:helix-turn-helix transcriptional regulator [Vibrio metschnikovii]|nr:helix-turn-helix transcriptional regulator [Vibrio metschnikovii]EKO3657443.1 helix-turn-helix transcriptional regulator [Vibrio metschnikovii]